MKIIYFIFILLLIALISLYSQESWILPYDSESYKIVEELLLNEWHVPPIDEYPMITEDLRNQVSALISSTESQDTIERGRVLLDDLKLPFEHIAPIIETALFTAYNSESGRRRVIETGDPSIPYPIIDFTYLYDIDKIPPLLTLGFTAQTAGFSIVFEPFLKASHSYLLDYPYVLNFPIDQFRIDTNLPQRGIGTYFNPPFEFRFGRDKLKIGPGRWSTLTISQNVPYFDYLKARFFTDWMSVSFYMIQLNPTISAGESDYLDLLYSGNDNPENNGLMNGKIYTERAKYYMLARLNISPFPWFYFNILQTNLIGGRYPWFSDINPLTIYHDNFSDGTYSVPLDLSLTVVPYKGIKLYFEFLLYDATVADEYDKTKNPTAFAYQAGFSVLSDPFFRLGPGRFRLDGEVSFVDPWTYGKYYDLRKFTSRIIYVESFVGRFWVDYPLGFYLGPDVVDLNLSLSYGMPGQWEAELHWNFSGKGEIDLYGWDNNNDYSHIGESEKYQVTGAPSGTVEWRNDIEFSYYYVPLKNLKLSAWYRVRTFLNQFNLYENNNIYHYIGIEALWKIY